MPPTPATTHRWVLALAIAAAAAPPLLAYNLPPSPTLINQCLAVALWGGFVWALAPAGASRRGAALQAALLTLMVGVLASWGLGSLPASLMGSTLGLLGSAMVLGWAGTQLASRRDAAPVFVAFAFGLVAAGVLSALVALVQVFAPGWTDGTVIAHSGVVGRAVGNLRQPNHLCSLLLWAVIAAVALHELGRLARGPTVALVVALVFAVELSASRTGAIGLLLLALWGALDKRLSRTGRLLLLATPLLYAASYGAMAAWAGISHQAVGAEARLAASSSGIESPNTRSRVWANALALIAEQPWTGVGFGEFNLAWSLTAFPGRPTAFFDHTHTLPLQLAVELGLPLAALVLALLGVALWQGWRRATAAAGQAGAAARAALVMVLLIGLHSLVEYPLWYAYFLLPAAFVWGFALGVPAADAAQVVAPARPGHARLCSAGCAPPDSAGQAFAAGVVEPPAAAVAGTIVSRRVGAMAGLALLLGGALALVDYRQVVVIFAPGEASASLAERIERGQRSVLFAHHADYAAATADAPLPGTALGLQRAVHNLLDTRLMMAWARHLAANGEPDLARWLAQRLREFRNADADEFFAPCPAGPQPDSTAFQCQLPHAAHGWREFVKSP